MCRQEVRSFPLLLGIGHGEMGSYFCRRNSNNIGRAYRADGRVGLGRPWE